MLVLCDRLWSNQINNTLTTSQSITTPTWPARDTAGSTNGDGVRVGLEVSAAFGAGTPTLTLGYTNQAGTGSKTAASVLATAASPVVATFYEFALAAGDTGVRSIQTYQQNATWTSGTGNLVAYRPLAFLSLVAGNTPADIDALTSGFAQIYNGAVLFFLFYPSTTTTSNIIAAYTETQG
jgi:hypothetical protein